MYDKIIIGGGIYGLYAAIRCGEKGQNVLVLEKEADAFLRATYINQARVHMGYHYPRSYSTAIKSRNYFDRFVEDYEFCIKKDFKKIYATSGAFSWTSAAEFEKFCKATDIMCRSVNPQEYFNSNMCDGAFETQEYTYDAYILKEYLLKQAKSYKNVSIRFNANVTGIRKTENGDTYDITISSGETFRSGFVLNATYASVNQLIKMLNFEPLKIKYELCEIILCHVDDILKDVGITVMDGPFFSLMPFGKTGLHSLTSVTFTPHITSYNATPKFICQGKVGREYCSPDNLGNCNLCDYKPQSAWPYMSCLAKKYLNNKYSTFTFKETLFSMKPILQASEIDDSRPTVIKVFSEEPTFVSVLSGKINTIYDLEDILS